MSEVGVSWVRVVKFHFTYAVVMCMLVIVAPPIVVGVQYGICAKIPC